MSKIVFVGNVPYNVTEEQLIEVFSSVGQVVGFRLVFDRVTNKSKGYGFCEFADHETALSAVRNLSNADVGGRLLRIDLAEPDPTLVGKSTIRGELTDVGFRALPGPHFEWRSQGGRNSDPDAFLSNVPLGIILPQGSSVVGSISQMLSSMATSHIIEVLALMKAFVISHPDHARTLLTKHPQMAYALFQVLLLNNIPVDPVILERMLASSCGSNKYTPVFSALRPRPPTGGLPQRQQHNAAGPANMYSHQPQYIQSQPCYIPPPASAPSVTPAAAQLIQPHVAPADFALTALTGGVSDAQKIVLMQAVSMTTEQIETLGDAEKSAVMYLRSRFTGGL